MNTIDQNFLSAINDSLSAYGKKGGARSNKKLIPIHKFLSEIISNKIGKCFIVKSLGVGTGKEQKFDGKYYPKNLDVAILQKERVIATISFKFVTSNYKQNANNYFEQLLGETANIRRQNIGFAHFLVLRGHTPYFSKNKGNLRGKEMKTEIIKERDIQKYIKVSKDMDFPHKPDLIGICILDMDKDKMATFANINSFDFSKETKLLLKNDFSLKVFMNKFAHLVKLKK